MRGLLLTLSPSAEECRKWQRGCVTAHMLSFLEPQLLTDLAAMNSGAVIKAGCHTNTLDFVELSHLEE